MLCFQILNVPELEQYYSKLHGPVLASNTVRSVCVIAKKANMCECLLNVGKFHSWNITFFSQKKIEIQRTLIHLHSAIITTIQNDVSVGWFYFFSTDSIVWYNWLLRAQFEIGSHDFDSVFQTIQYTEYTAHDNIKYRVALTSYLNYTIV